MFTLDSGLGFQAFLLVLLRPRLSLGVLKWLGPPPRYPLNQLHTASVSPTSLMVVKTAGLLHCICFPWTSDLLISCFLSTSTGYLIDALRGMCPRSNSRPAAYILWHPLYQQLATPSFQVSWALNLGVILGFPSLTSHIQWTSETWWSISIQSCSESDWSSSPLPFPGAGAAFSSHLGCSPASWSFPPLPLLPSGPLFCT